MNYEIFKPFIELSSSLLTPLIGIVATWILILQYKLANWRWKLDLYNKRYPVYLVTINFISKIGMSNENNDELLYNFLREARDKEFLFGYDVQEFLLTLYKKGNDLDTHQRIFKDLPVGKERSKHVKDAGDLKIWFASQYEPAKTIFSSYLKIDKK
jgi:hypothetical protein